MTAWLDILNNHGLKPRFWPRGDCGNYLRWIDNGVDRRQMDVAGG